MKLVMRIVSASCHDMQRANLTYEIIPTTLNELNLKRKKLLMNLLLRMSLSCCVRMSYKICFVFSFLFIKAGVVITKCNFTPSF